MLVKFSDVDSELLESWRRQVGRVCAVGRPHDAVGISLDITVLSPGEQAKFDDGALPKRYVEWWLRQAAQVCSMGGAAVIRLQPGLLGRRRVEPLAVNAFQDLMDQSIWWIPTGVILCWGVPERAMNKNHLRRVPCVGAIGVALDGYGAFLMAEEGVCEQWSW